MKPSINFTIHDYQVLVENLALKRGFDKETVPETFTLLIEEIGELAKAIRKNNGQKVDNNSLEYNIEEEAADVFFLLLDLCNHLNIDLAEAFRKKEIKNQTRVWN